MAASMNFSNRVRAHPRISAFPDDPVNWRSLAVVDQLLVCESAWEPVHVFLNSRGIAHTVLARVLDGLVAVPGAEDVRILQVTVPGGQDIFGLTDEVRAGANQTGDHARKVSPNHVLIPAMENHGCPHGPPSPVANPGPALGHGSPPLVPITIIDSGYQWAPAPAGMANPLEAYGLTDADVLQADYVTTTGWEPGIPDVRDADRDGSLDALAGHANFIAGVIAQLFDRAKITIRNHNGGYAPGSDDFATEASVARSLCESTDAKVIDLGFAFMNYDDGPISCVWDLALKQLGNNAVVVVPAGNNESDRPRYPAALCESHPEVVVSVASVDREDDGGGKPVLSDFTNYGNWITCSACGRDVVSTFLIADLPAEDDPSDKPEPRNFDNGWASWNGTSFAAPKIVAAIARELATEPAKTPIDARDAIVAGGKADPDGRVGRVVTVA